MESGSVSVHTMRWYSSQPGCPRVKGQISQLGQLDGGADYGKLKQVFTATPLD